MNLFQKLKNWWDDDELMFKIGTGFKFVLISLFFVIVAFGFTYVMVKIDLNYFNDKGFSGAIEFEDAFFDFIYQSIGSKWPFIVIAFLGIFLAGYYIAIIMMRPFKTIARFCEEQVSNQSMQYSTDLFTDLKLLTSFTSFFFARIDEAKVRGRFENVEIPLGFTRIHKPILEKNFFLNYFFVIIVFSLLASIGILILNFEIHEQVLFLGKQVLQRSTNAEVTIFLNNQFEITKIVIEFLLGFHSVVYCMFGFHLYSKVSTPAFAVFATMRSFLKGNVHNRIHLVGYSYLRNDCRKINKYLDFVQKTIVKK